VSFWVTLVARPDKPKVQPSQAHPTPLLQDLLRLMQLLPQALPFLHILQQYAGIILGDFSNSNCSERDNTVGSGVEIGPANAGDIKNITQKRAVSFPLIIVKSL
jgi:hypothetical protein